MTESIIDICETLISLPDSTSIPNIELYFVWLFHEDITLPSSFAASLLETNQADTTSTAGVSHLIDSKSEKKGDQFHWIWRSESPLEDTDVDEFIEPRSISFCTRAYCRRLACRYEQESSQNEIDARMDRLYHIHKSIIYGDCLLDHRDDWNDDKWTSLLPAVSNTVIYIAYDKDEDVPWDELLGVQWSQVNWQSPPKPACDVPIPQSPGSVL